MSFSISKATVRTIEFFTVCTKLAEMTLLTSRDLTAAKKLFPVGLDLMQEIITSIRVQCLWLIENRLSFPLKVRPTFLKSSRFYRSNFGKMIDTYSKAMFHSASHKLKHLRKSCKNLKAPLLHLDVGWEMTMYVNNSLVSYLYSAQVVT